MLINYDYLKPHLSVQKL